MVQVCDSKAILVYAGGIPFSSFHVTITNPTFKSFSISFVTFNMSL